MKLIIHDLDKENVDKTKFNCMDIVIDSSKCVHNCVGCLNCFKNKSGNCKILDDYYNLGRILSVVDELIIISKSRYGCYSSDVKKVLERIIGYVQMNFEIRKGRMRHRFRYNNKIKLSTYFYDNYDSNTKKCVYNLVNNNNDNLCFYDHTIKFISDIGEICIQ